MKRVFLLLISTFLLLIPLTACTPTSDPPEPPSTPDPTQTSTTPPVPTPTPEPATALEHLQDALLAACGEELDALGGYRIRSSEENANFPEWAAETYGLPVSGLAGGFVIDDQNGTLFELIVLQVAGQALADQTWDALAAYKDRLQEPFYQLDENGVRVVSEEGAAAYFFLNGAYRSRNGEYQSLLICQNAAEASKALRDAIDNLLQEGIAQPQAVEIGEGVFFVDVSQSEAEGDPDPDHPGRARYIQPNEEDMSLYDTSAIVAAWQSGDLGSLSQEERAIYDRAKEVLGSLLQDGMSDFAMEAAIYEWVLQNVEYDWSHTDVMAETARTSYTPYGGLVEGKAICLGYATTFQLLSELSGLECITVVGASKGADHAWNQVCLNGEWYCVDSAWDWPYGGKGAEGSREWRYFNTTSDYLARTGHQWDYDKVPEATAQDHGFPKNGQ